MKNIQVIDGADNCTFSIFQATDEEFNAIFPGEGQDIEFSEDMIERLGEENCIKFVAPIWERPIRKSEAMGIHGTLYYEFLNKRKYFPNSKREKDYASSSINAAQRRMFGQK